MSSLHCYCYLQVLQLTCIYVTYFLIISAGTRSLNRKSLHLVDSLKNKHIDDGLLVMHIWRVRYQTGEH